MRIEAGNEPAMTAELQAALHRRRQLTASPEAAPSTLEVSPQARIKDVRSPAGLLSPHADAPRASQAGEQSVARRGASRPTSAATTPSQTGRSAESMQKTPSAYTKVSTSSTESFSILSCNEFESQSQSIVAHGSLRCILPVPTAMRVDCRDPSAMHARKTKLLRAGNG